MSEATAQDRQAIESFLFREARYADENRYDEWMALWTDDAVYWVPANGDDRDPHRHLSIIYDLRERLQDRVDRLKSGAAWAQEPRSRMRRLVSNMEIDRLSAALAKAVVAPEVIARFATVGLEPVSDTRPEAQSEQMRYDLAKYIKVVKNSGIKAE